jgi:N-methylhydantoinase A
VLPAREAASQGHRLLLSGPAGGVVGASAFALAAGAPDAVTMDMGGTTFDTCLVLAGLPAVRPESQAAGHPVLGSAIDLVTVGAGGGSIASVDRGGALVVGPRSAGARPGPACYGLGGTKPTITDANLAVGRLDAETFLDGRLRLDRDAAERVIHDAVAVPLGLSVQRAALAIHEVAVATMARALRVVTVGRGRDPAALPLVAFGGAGPLAATALADELGSSVVLVPPLPGFVSAIGLLATDLRTELARTVMRPGRRTVSSRQLARAVATLTREGQRRLDRPASSTVAIAVDCRYEGQGYELTVPLAAPTDDAMADAAAAFHRVHDGVFGHSAPEEPVETVAIRVTVTAPGASFAPSTIAGPIDEPPSPTTLRKVFDGQGWKDTPVFDRRGLRAGWNAGGPLVIAEGESTSWVPAGWRVQTDAFGTLRATREANGRA